MKRSRCLHSSSRGHASAFANVKETGAVHAPISGTNRMSSLLLLFQDEHAHHMDWTPPGPDPVSLFNHHVSGWLVVGLAVFAYLEQTGLVRFLWVKYGWPFILFLQSMFTLIWSDNAQFWPFELERWARHWVAWQHKIFAFAALTLAAIEFLRRRGTLKHPAWPHILNALIIGAGVFLWFHQGHHTPVIHRQHQWMSIEIFSLGVVKTITDIQNRPTWLRLYVVPLLFLALGLQLVFYVE